MINKGKRHAACTRKRAIAAYKANAPVKVACRELNITYTTLYRWLREADVPRMRYPVRVSKQKERRYEGF